VKSFVTLALVFCIAPLVASQTQTQRAPAAQVPKIDALKEKHIRELLDLIGLSRRNVQLTESLLNQMQAAIFKPESQDERSRKFRALVNERLAKKMTDWNYGDIYLPIYDRNFTDEEIQELIRFFGSPLGQKHRTVQMQMMGEFLQTAMPTMMKMTKEAEEEVYKEHPELKPGVSPDSFPNGSHR
jgi:hypothetical protein